MRSNGLAKPMVAVIYLDQNNDHIFKLYRLNLTKKFYRMNGGQSYHVIENEHWTFRDANHISLDYSLTS